MKRTDVPDTKWNGTPYAERRGHGALRGRPVCPRLSRPAGRICFSVEVGNVSVAAGGTKTRASVLSLDGFHAARTARERWHPRRSWALAPSEAIEQQRPEAEPARFGPHLALRFPVTYQRPEGELRLRVILGARWAGARITRVTRFAPRPALHGPRPADAWRRFRHPMGPGQRRDAKEWGANRVPW